VELAADVGRLEVSVDDVRRPREGELRLLRLVADRVVEPRRPALFALVFLGPQQEAAALFVDVYAGGAGSGFGVGAG
jgi:hypothetical protein